MRNPDFEFSTLDLSIPNQKIHRAESGVGKQLQNVLDHATSNLLSTLKFGSFILLIFLFADPAVMFEYTTTTKEDFYLGEPLRVSCRGTNFPTAAIFGMFLAHIYAYNTPTRIQDGCVNAGTWSQLGQPPENLVVAAKSINNPGDCETLAQKWYMETNITITDEITDVTLLCQANIQALFDSTNFLRVAEVKGEIKWLQMHSLGTLQ